MTVKEMIKMEIDKLPENMLVEIYDFVRFLETKKERALLTQIRVISDVVTGKIDVRNIKI